MIRSTFFGFTTALRGLSASQKSLDVTGQNISNYNTAGYTRQRLDLYSSASGFGDMYTSNPSTSIGQGADIGGVEQYRDAFLDVRFRREACKLGEEDSKLATLDDLGEIFDETTSDGLNNQVSDFIKQLQSLSAHTGNAEFDGIAKASAEVLTKLFNQYSKQVSTVREQQEYSLNNVALTKVNDMLKSIGNLNQSIRDNQVHGSPSLELKDQRNTLIDELSTYMKIDVSYTQNEIAPGLIVDDVKINLISNTLPSIPLVSNDKYATFSSTKDAATGKIDINCLNATAVPPATAVSINANLDTGILKGTLDMLNKSGEFDTPTNTTRGIGYYEKVLDTIASSLATAFNDANKLTDGTARPLFGTNDGTATITAKNLTIAKGWVDSTYGITASKNTNTAGNNAGASDNILLMVSLFSKKMDFTTPAGVSLFKGTFQEGLGQANNVLALDTSSTQKIVKNYLTVLNGVDDSRSAISAVSLDEEGVNLLRYQKSYNAAARLMTTLDEAIDTIINKLGTVGR